MAPKKSFVRWLIAAAVLLFFIVAMLLLDRTLTLEPLMQWALRLSFVLLGLIAAGAIVWFLRPMETEPGRDPGDDVLLTLGGASARLPKRRFGSRPIVIVLGPEGSAKTSLIARSGGDPEMLAGDPTGGLTDTPPPTKTANVWLMQQAVLAELSSSLLTDVPRFGRVIRALRAPRLAALSGKNEGAPRAAVICVPCDLFYAGGNGEQLAALGQTLRQRLAETSRTLGLALPVYVVFTRMDRLPYFAEWAGVFTKDELRTPLGATLSFDSASETGSYAERLTPRVDRAFKDILDAMSLRRVELLNRDSVLDRRYGAYEFPREMRKLLPSVSAFLIELCRPTQLGSSPLLRGFYFVGARAVLVSDVATEQKASAAAAAPSASQATQIFRELKVSAPTPASSGPAQTRKVPEWVFLDRFFRDVVLADPAANSIARGGVRVQRTRRAVFASAIAASVLLALGITVSWFGNRALSDRIARAATDVAAVQPREPGNVSFPQEQSLRRLETLRSLLDTVRTYEKDGAPWHLRFGLWDGQALLGSARPIWDTGFRNQLFTVSWNALSDSLRRLPDVPSASDDYGKTYSWLKSYLITTTHNDSSTADFLSPVLLASAQGAQKVDSANLELAHRQFDFYATDLPTYNPFPKQPEPRTLTRARLFLSRFTGGDQFYFNMLASVNKMVPADTIPQAPGLLTDAVTIVPGAFTAVGADSMKVAFQKPLPADASWVLGDATESKLVDRDAIVQGLKPRYHDDYVKTWRQVVSGASVAKPTSLADAAAKLDRFAAPTSPILDLLRAVAVQTAIDSTMKIAFQPVHAVSPPTTTKSKLISDKNKPYMEGLASLSGSLRQVGAPPAPTDSEAVKQYVEAAKTAGGDVKKARDTEKVLSQSFELGAGSPFIASVEKLLLDPIVGAEAMLTGAAGMKPSAKRVVAAAPAAAPAAAGGGGGGPSIADKLNARGASLCSTMNTMLAKFPFSPDASNDAVLGEVSSLLAPGTGQLWTFQQEGLKDFLEKQGGKWVGKPVGKVALSESFVNFFNRAARVSELLFPRGAASPQMNWDASGIVSDATPNLVLKFGDKVASFDKRTPRNVVTWPNESGRNAQLEATFKKNKPQTVATVDKSDWALFRLVAQAAKFDGTGLVTWNATGRDALPVAVQFDLRDGTEPVLKRGWLGGQLACVAQVTQ